MRNLFEQQWFNVISFQKPKRFYNITGASAIPYSGALAREPRLRSTIGKKTW